MSSAQSVFDSLFSNFWIVLLLKTVAVVAFFLVVPLGIGYVEHKGTGAHAGAARADGGGPVPRVGAARGRRREVHPEGGRHARGGRSQRLLAGARRRDDSYIAIHRGLPLSDSWFAENLDIGIFYVLAISSISVIGVMMAGWSSANKFSLIGALRAAAQLIAYELPLVIAAAAS